MLYVVEISDQGEPSCWTAVNKKDFIAKVQEKSRQINKPLIEKTTFRQLIKDQGYTNPEQARYDYKFGKLIKSGYNLDTPVYIDHAILPGSYCVEPPDEYEACYIWLETQMHSRVFEDEAEAYEAAQCSKLWARHGGNAAREALCNELDKFNSAEARRLPSRPGAAKPKLVYLYRRTGNHGCIICDGPRQATWSTPETACYVLPAGFRTTRNGTVVDKYGDEVGVYSDHLLRVYLITNNPHSDGSPVEIWLAPATDKDKEAALADDDDDTL